MTTWPTARNRRGSLARDRATRLRHLLLWLEDQDGATAEGVATELDVSVSTARRYLAELHDAGSIRADGHRDNWTIWRTP